MGCNTSKDAALPLGEETEKAEDSNVKEEAITETSKPESAKTVTLTSNGFVLPQVEESSEKADKDPELEDAAVKIQAAFRGHKTRKNMKQPAKHEDKSPSSQNLEEEFSADDKDLCNAATKIQASFRGHMIRKQMEDKKDDSPTPTNKNEEEELDIDLSDPDLNKAAVKIQASFRGHMVRKENEPESN